MESTKKSATWRRLGILSTQVLALALAIGWWRDYRSRSMEVEHLRIEIEQLSSQTTDDSLDDMSTNDLIKFIDEAYALLRAEGIHVKLDLDVDENGRYRLRANSVELMEELKAKLRELDERPAPRQP